MLYTVRWQIPNIASYFDFGSMLMSIRVVDRRSRYNFGVVVDKKLFHVVGITVVRVRIFFINLFLTRAGPEEGGGV